MTHNYGPDGVGGSEGLMLSGVVAMTKKTEVTEEAGKIKGY